MLSSGLVAVSLLLATHGAEGSREEKFRGALIAQSFTANDAAAIQREIELLTLDRPSFTAPITIFAVGAGFAAIGGLILFTSLSDFSTRLFGAMLLGVAALAGVVGLVVLVVVAVVRANTDERLKVLEQQLKSPPPNPPSASLVLARF